MSNSGLNLILKSSLAVVVLLASFSFSAKVVDASQDYNFTIGPVNIFYTLKAIVENTTNVAEQNATIVNFYLPNGIVPSDVKNCSSSETGWRAVNASYSICSVKVWKSAPANPSKLVANLVVKPNSSAFSYTPPLVADNKFYNVAGPLFVFMGATCSAGCSENLSMNPTPRFVKYWNYALNKDTAITIQQLENTTKIVYTYRANQDFTGVLRFILPLNYADYQRGLIVIRPRPFAVRPGSIVADMFVSIKKDETVTVEVEVKQKLDESVLSQFSQPLVLPDESVKTAPAAKSTPGKQSAEPPLQTANIDWRFILITGFMIIVALVFVGVYAGVMMRQ